LILKFTSSYDLGDFYHSLAKGELTSSTCFNSRLLSISARCCSGRSGSPTAFSVSSKSCTGVNFANSQTLSCGKNYQKAKDPNEVVQQNSGKKKALAHHRFEHHNKHNTYSNIPQNK
jgi:hypothetical protein